MILRGIYTDMHEQVMDGLIDEVIGYLPWVICPYHRMDATTKIIINS